MAKAASMAAAADWPGMAAKDVAAEGEAVATVEGEEAVKATARKGVVAREVAWKAAAGLVGETSVEVALWAAVMEMAALVAAAMAPSKRPLLWVAC